MPYKISIEAKEFISKINKNGKDKALVTPSYKPPLDLPVKYLCIFFLILSIVLYFFTYKWISAASFGLAVILFLIRDFFIQDDHSLVRIYGPLGRGRYLIEDMVRDKFLQYFTESNTNGRPIPKVVRDYIYQKAKGVKPLTSFGTELDINDSDNTANVRILHRNFPAYKIEPASYECIIGEGRSDIKPFIVKNIINVSAMSYGSLNWKAAECISFGAKDICYVNTGEGGYGPHGVAGNDVVFQIGTGKFGVGDHAELPNGQPTRKLNDQLLIDLVKANENIKMIQIKISQGAKPGLGGHLPAEKVIPEIAEVRKVEPYKSVISPAQHAETIASTPKESVLKLLDFIKHVRRLTNLPVGIKFAVGRLDEIDLLINAMLVTKEGPDAIQIDGADGGTGAGPNLFVNYVGYGGVVETVAYLDKKLKDAGLREKVKISSSGKIFTPVHAALSFAYGTDIIDTARAAMLSLGCIQALKCHTGHCPTGITSSDSWRMHGLVLEEKSTRIHKFFKGFNEDMLELTKVMGHSDPRDITPDDIRTVTYKSTFSNHFEEDPFGLWLPTSDKLMSE